MNEAVEASQRVRSSLDKVCSRSELAVETTDCNSGVSISDSVENGESGVFNSVSVDFRIEGFSGVYINGGSGELNGARGFDIAVSHDGDDTNSDNGVRDGKDEELNSDGNSASNGVLGGKNENKEVLNLLTVIAVLFLGRPSGLCIKACNFFSRFLCCLPIKFFLFPMGVDEYKPIIMIIYLHVAAMNIHIATYMGIKNFRL